MRTAFSTACAVAATALVLATSEASAQVCARPPAGLAGWWPANGAPSDLVGRGDARLRGDVTFAPAVVGQGFVLDGMGDAVEIPDSVALRPPVMSVEAWVRFDALDTPSVSQFGADGLQYIVFKRNTREFNFEGYALRKERRTGADRFAFSVADRDGVGGDHVAYSTTPIIVNRFYHVVGTYDGRAVRLFVNGQLEAAVEIALRVDYDTRPIVLGSSGETVFDGRLRGIIDEASIYARALEAEEVKALYDAGTAGKCVEPPPVSARQPARDDVALSSATHEATTADMPGLTAATSRCEISTDPTYGTRDNPVRLGGPDHPAAREIAYMHALRGPAGQGLHFWRRGSLPANGSVLDLYVVELAGTADPIRIYIDGYRASLPKAPVGLLCGLAITVSYVRPDPRETQRQLMAVAVGLANADLKPIPLDRDGSTKYGMAFDHVRLVARAAFAAQASGSSLDPAALPGEIARPMTVIVALPWSCSGKLIAPRSIEYTGGLGTSPPVLSTATGTGIQKLVPGLQLPAEALAASYDAPWVFEDGKVTVHYEEPCGRDPADRTFVPKYDEGDASKKVKGKLPAGATHPPGTRVAVQIFCDAEGKPLFPTFVGGFSDLKDAAIEAAMQWRLKPPRLNGAPIYDFVTVVIEFEKD